MSAAAFCDEIASSPSTTAPDRIGTNNYSVTQSDGGNERWDLRIDTPPGDVAEGVRAIAQEFRRRLPTTRVIILGILPVEDRIKRTKCQETNRILAGYAYPGDQVVFLDVEDRFLEADPVTP